MQRPRLVGELGWSAAAGLALGWLTASGAKPQAVRLLDVAVLGPLLVHPRTPRPVLAFLGGATVAYNLRNYLLAR